MPRILTYNVHRCVGTDRKLDVGRIVEVIASFEPDIVALQELDVGRARTDMADQAHEIAQGLEMAFHFHPAMRVEEELYGDAILTLYPERLVQAAPLPSHNYISSLLEPRGALWVAVDINGTELQIINTHFGLVTREKKNQALAMAGPAWLEHPRFTAPGILLGDFNAAIGSRPYRILNGKLTDARKLVTGRPRSTRAYPSKWPVFSIDHVFVTPGITITGAFAALTPLSRVASDHLPLIVDFDLN